LYGKIPKSQADPQIPKILGKKSQAVGALITSVNMIRWQASSLDLEALVTSQCEELIEAIRRRHAELLVSVREQRCRKQQTVSDTLADCTQLLHRTTGLLQFGVEVLKEPDPTAFLLVRNSFTPNSPDVYVRPCLVRAVEVRVDA